MSDISKVFDQDDICTLWTDTWKFYRMGGDYTRCCIDGMTRFSLKYWSWMIDRLLVSHRFGIIRYLGFLQGITKVRVQILTEISRSNCFLKLASFKCLFYKSWIPRCLLYRWKLTRIFHSFTFQNLRKIILIFSIFINKDQNEFDILNHETRCFTRHKCINL